MYQSYSRFLRDNAKAASRQFCFFKESNGVSLFKDYRKTDMKIVPLGSSGTVLTSFRFLTSACHFWAKTQHGLRMSHE